MENDLIKLEEMIKKLNIEMSKIYDKKFAKENILFIDFINEKEQNYFPE